MDEEWMRLAFHKTEWSAATHQHRQKSRQRYIWYLGFVFGTWGDVFGILDSVFGICDGVLLAFHRTEWSATHRGADEQTKGTTADPTLLNLMKNRDFLHVPC